MVPRLRVRARVRSALTRRDPPCVSFTCTHVLLLLRPTSAALAKDPRRVLSRRWGAAPHASAFVVFVVEQCLQCTPSDQRHTHANTKHQVSQPEQCTFHFVQIEGKVAVNFTLHHYSRSIAFTQTYAL